MSQISLVTKLILSTAKYLKLLLIVQNRFQALDFLPFSFENLITYAELRIKKFFCRKVELPMFTTPCRVFSAGCVATENVVAIQKSPRTYFGKTWPWKSTKHEKYCLHNFVKCYAYWLWYTRFNMAIELILYTCE